MKINKMSNINNLQNREIMKIKKINPVPKVETTNATVFEKSKTEDKGQVYNKTTIDKLRLESAKSFDSLKRMVEDMLSRQGKAFSLLNPQDTINIDEETRAEANALIGADGPFGIEAMSDKIVEFAIAISGGDKSKLDTLIAAIDKGFSEAGRILGGLPDISLKTYDRIMAKLDDWKNE